MLVLLLGGALPGAAWAEDAALTGTEIFKRCGYKNPGDDQTSKFTVILRDKDGKVNKSEYLRFWKDFKGRDGVTDKMLLFTIYPPDAKGSAFMRVAYTHEQNRNVDQWIYLPVLRKIRRVSIRDPGDNFLNSNLTYADVSRRALEEDDHKLLGIKRIKDLEFFVVESTPREQKPLYSKRVFWFLKTADLDDCVNTRIDYFDKNGALLKEQFIKWQKMRDAWVWDRVLVRNVQSLNASIFQISDLRINSGLDDNIFSARTLRHGPGVIPGFGTESAPPATDPAGEDGDNAQ